MFEKGHFQYHGDLAHQHTHSGDSNTKTQLIEWDLQAVSYHHNAMASLNLGSSGFRQLVFFRLRCGSTQSKMNSNVFRDIRKWNRHSSSKLERTFNQKTGPCGFYLLHILLSETSPNWWRRSKHLRLWHLRSARLAASNCSALLSNFSSNERFIVRTSSLHESEYMTIIINMLYTIYRYLTWVQMSHLIS